LLFCHIISYFLLIMLLYVYGVHMICFTDDEDKISLLNLLTGYISLLGKVENNVLLLYVFGTI